MEGEFKGSCLCTQVKYSVMGAAHGFYLCHCQYCQKGTGSAHAANLFFPNARLTWLQGKSLVKCFSIPNTRHLKAFCTCCGSPLPSVQEVGIVVPAGSLDEAPTIIPSAHLFVASRADWDNQLEKIVAFDTLPTQ
ncbi:GFA family protein [Pseudoalteromonas piscicida]|uniref:GFA family protein n=1 Tax=Pseudoalteromonas piscicida TaxID=43662 RepID=UPI0030A1CE8A